MGPSHIALRPSDVCACGCVRARAFYSMRQCLEGSVLSGQLLRRRRELQQRGVELRLQAARLRQPRRELGRLPLERLEGLLVIELGSRLPAQGLDLQMILLADAVQPVVVLVQAGQLLRALLERRLEILEHLERRA
jgi:hypothetical protein